MPAAEYFADEHADALAAATLQETVEVPARTADDALAALENLVRDEVDFSYMSARPVVVSMVKAI